MAARAMEKLNVSLLLYFSTMFVYYQYHEIFEKVVPDEEPGKGEGKHMHPPRHMKVHLFKQFMLYYRAT